MPKLSWTKRHVRNRARLEVAAILERPSSLNLAVTEHSAEISVGTACNEECIQEITVHSSNSPTGCKSRSSSQQSARELSPVRSSNFPFSSESVSPSQQNAHCVLECISEIQSPVDSSDVEHELRVRIWPESDPMTDGPQPGTHENSVWHDEKGSSNASDNFPSELARWAVVNNITHQCLSALLVLLKTHICFSTLPKDARTLLKTPRATAVVADVTYLPPGQYCHFGLEKGLSSLLGEVHSAQKVSLSFNIDGLPLSKSSREQLWPIQCLAHFDCSGHESTMGPIIVGAFVGSSKPDCANAFLKPFVDELKHLLLKGILVIDKPLKVEIRNFICDAPARAFIFKTKGHSGYSGCPKCTVEGSYKEKMFFPAASAMLRTDQSFRNQTDLEHHQGVSLLMELPIDSINSVPLDPMHLVYLGVVRKLVNTWLSGPLVFRLGPTDRKEISVRNVALEKHVPMEFVRKPRTLEEKDRWKATEFRALLHYTGPIILKNVLSEAVYSNFLVLHVAITILSTRSLCQDHAGFAETLLKHFVKGFVQLYGEEEVSYNVHCLLHLAEDARLYGPLDAFSAFPFESNMQFIKRLLRKPGCRLSQLYNRLEENRMHKHQADVFIRQSSPFTLLGESTEGNLPVDCKFPKYNAVKFQSFTLSLKPSDNCCQVDEDIVIAEGFAHRRSDGNPCIFGRLFCNIEPLYSYPLDSTRLGIAIVSKLSSVKCWPVEKVKKKLVKLPYKDKFVVLPLLHTA